jgi:antirestriction protein ArdC
MNEQVTRSSDPVEAPVPNRDFRKEVTDQIVEMLERGTAPWQKPWEPGALQLPFNPTTERNYRGGNALQLMAAAVRKGYDDPRWLTYRQAQENGCQVRQGEKGTHIEYWQFEDRTGQADSPSGDELNARSEPRPDEHGHRGIIRRVYTVFNARQIEGMPDYIPQKRHEWQVAQTGEQILRNSGASISHDQNDRAFYSRAQDTIHLPPKEAFKGAADYYGTALHELAHWTGHPDRLNRQTLNDSYSFGDQNYAKEELRAELASVFLAAERGIPHSPEQHAAYVASWITALKNDKNEIFRAARDAHKAADFILELERGKPIEAGLPRQIRRETSEHVADYERGSDTVNITEKKTATEDRNPAAVNRSRTPDKHAPVKVEAEKILDGEVNGRRPARSPASSQSFGAAEEVAKRMLGNGVRVYAAETDSGKYRGEILADTEHHVVQKVSARSAVVHAKHLIPNSVTPGQSVTVAYSNGQAQLKPMKARQKPHALSR